MRFVRGVLDRAVLLAAVLLAACIPSFIVQYRQRIGGRLDQVLADLAPFQAIADRNYGGDLGALVRHHLASTDASFHQEGAALQGMLDAAAQLRAAWQGLNSDLIHQCLYVALHPDAGLLRSTWSSYQPGFTLTLPGIAFALIVGLLLWALFLTVWLSVAGLLRIGPRPRPRQMSVRHF